MKMDHSLSNVTEILENVLAKRILWMTNVKNVKLNITTSLIAKNASVILKVLQTITVMSSLGIVTVKIQTLLAKIVKNVKSRPMITPIVKVCFGS